ncbi:MAG: sensor histidine kinase [Roseiflexus sp.]
MHPFFADPSSVAEPNRSTPRWVVAGWTAIVLVVPSALALERVFSDPDRLYPIALPLYFTLVAGIATMVGTMAMLIVVAAWRARDDHTLAVGLGLLGGAATSLVHTLKAASLPNTTPGYPVVSLAVIGIFIVIGVFGASPIAQDRRPRTRRYVALFSVLLIVGVGWLFVPAISDIDTLIRLIIVIACGIALWQYIQLYRRSSIRFSFAFLAGIALLGEAAVIQQIAVPVYALSFWLYHTAAVVALALIAYVALFGVRERMQRSLVERVAFELVRPAMVEAIDALIGTLERREPVSADLRIRLQRDAGFSSVQIDALENFAIVAAREQSRREELEHFDAMRRQSERNVTLLAQMVIHDLKNPLTALIGFLELLETAELNELQRTLVESSLRTGRNLAGLVDDLLDLARYNEGRLHLRLSDVSLPDLCTECAIELAGWLAYESKTLILDVPQTLPTIRADGRLLRRILLNLLSNSLKHTPYGTTITLRIWREPHPDGGEQTVIEVTDTGPGIPPDQIERIFEPFVGAGEGRTSRQSSTGLGLAFCKMAVEAHGGTIEVSSFPGDGATFRIRLPDL